MSDSLKYEIVNAVICEDVRREDNGKEILIGVYGGDIRVNRLPLTLNLSFWLQVQKEEAGDISLMIRLVGPHDISVFATNPFPKAPLSPGFTSIVISSKVQFQIPGQYALEFSRNEGRSWEVIRTIPLLVGARPAPKIS